jgi:hypothetical protein
MDFLRKLMGWAQQEEEESGVDGPGSEALEALEDAIEDFERVPSYVERLRKRKPSDDNRYY